MNKPEDIIAKLSQLFEKLYVGTDCSTIFKVGEVCDMLKPVFGFNGDDVEQGNKILQLSQMTKPTKQLLQSESSSP